VENKQILSEIIVQISGFLIVFFILRKFAWRSVLGMVDARRQKIRSELDGIESGKKSLEALEKEYRARLENIEQEARVKIQEASNIGVALARDIQEKARTDAQKLLERAKAEIDQDLAKARLSMRDEVVELSSLMTEKVLKQKLGAEDHRRLVEQFIQEIEKV
jgi:F-type H+-transporting ATPase subunit b